MGVLPLPSHPGRPIIVRVLLVLLAWGPSLVGCSPASTPEPSPTAAITPTAPGQPTILSSSSLVPVPAVSLPLGGEWRFAVDMERIGEDEGWAEPGFDDSGWTAVTVPHTWGVTQDYAEYDGMAWYRRNFTLPAEAQAAHLRLRFDAVFYLARVWVNGAYLGQHEGGYTPFEFDVSEIARPGAENVIAVRADNMRAPDRIPASLGASWSFDWWNYGGIVRDVSLEMTSRAYIARQQVVAVPNLVGIDQADRATVRARLTLHNGSQDQLAGSVTADVLDEADGRSVLSSLPSAPVSLAPGQSADVDLVVEVMQPKLWHFDHPHLYRWSAALLGPDAEVLHTHQVTFGIRLVALKEARFYLNGEPMRLVGLTRHADSPWHGLAETAAIMSRDYDDLKTLNMVLSRPVHYPQHQFILDYCDRHGILLIPEVPAWQLKEGHMQSQSMRELEKQQLREMVYADFNHASVWAWSVGNEYDSKTAAGHEFTRDMIEYVKSLDPTRPVGFASRELGNLPEYDATAVADFVLMNQYFGTWAAPKGGLSSALDQIHATWPDKVVIISEYGFESRWNAYWGPPSSSLDPSQHYFVPEDTPGTSEEADLQRRLVISEQMQVFRSKPFVAAAVFWTYQDYRTPSGFIMGVVDAERNRRGSWDLLREEYAPVLIESVAFGPASGGERRATVRLRTRGPTGQDMPAYTLRGYHVHWAITSPGGEQAFAAGDVRLPTLEPGTGWAGDIQWPEPAETDYVLSVSVIRPTGFPVIEDVYAYHQE